MASALKWLWNKGVLNNFLAGVFVILPVAVTVGLVAWIVDKLKGPLGPGSVVGRGIKALGDKVLADTVLPEHLATLELLVGWAIVLIAIWALGLLLRVFAKHRLDEVFHSIVNKIPLISKVYKPISQVVGLLKKDDQNDIKGMSVVICSFGHAGGGKFLALQASNEAYRFGDKKDDFKLVSIPTSPVHMSGGLIFVRECELEKIEMSVDDLMKVYFSLGVLSPQVIPNEFKAAAASRPAA